MLLEAIEGGTPADVTLPTELVVRGSTATPLTTAPPRRGSPAPASSPVAGSAAHRLGAAEEHVEVLERRELAAVRGERLDVDARLRVDDAVLPVHARRLDGADEREPAVDHAEDHLQDRGADAVRARGAEREVDRAVARHHGRRHHRRQPAAGGWVRTRAARGPPRPSCC